MKTGLYSQSIKSSLRAWETKLDRVEQAYAKLTDKSTEYAQEHFDLIAVYRHVLSVLKYANSVQELKDSKELREAL